MTEAKDRFYYAQKEPEKAILVGLDCGDATWSTKDSLSELERLAQTAGATTLFKLTQRLTRKNPKTLIGSGKVKELNTIIHNLKADVVIFDDELTPSQQNNLEKILGDDIKVIDRCALILDIFGMHAKTSDGRLQVQLAQLQYLLPRLKGMWSHLVGEQTRGGIGSRFGQGESQIEVDRRLIRKRIQKLKDELSDLEKRRNIISKKRRESQVFRVSLVGYTNAGKSTLLNLLCDSDVFVADELFATLDPTTRTLVLDEGRTITLTDTVGFIQKLPTMLIDAFKSTLMEASDADLLLIVVDASDPHFSEELTAVETILKDIHADTVNSVKVFNKCDLIDADQYQRLQQTYPDAQFISALSKFGMPELLMRLAKEASAKHSSITLLIPFSKGSMINLIHSQCRIIREEYTEEGVLITCTYPQYLKNTIDPYKRD